MSSRCVTARPQACRCCVYAGLSEERGQGQEGTGPSAPGRHRLRGHREGGAGLPGGGLGQAGPLRGQGERGLRGGAGPAGGRGRPRGGGRLRSRPLDPRAEPSRAEPWRSWGRTWPW